MYLNRVPFILIGNFGTLDIDSESGAIIDAIGADNNKIGVLLDKAAFALIFAVDPIKSNKCSLE